MPTLANRTLSVAIIGYGKMGRLRADIVRRHPQLKLVGVCEPRAGDRPGDCVLVEDYRELLGQNVDVVFVCTPNAWNVRMTVDALNAGKHVFCEKPPARNTEEFQAILEAERNHPTLKLKFGFNHRYHDGVIEAKALVDSGRMGRLLWLRGIYGKAGGAGFESSWRNRADISGGGILIDQGIHMVDLFRHFSGEFNEVKSFVSRRFWNIDVEDNAFSILRNPDGMVAMLHSSSTHWKQRFTLEVFLEKGYVAVNGILSQSRGYGRESLIVAQRDAEFSAAPNPREEITYFDVDHSWQREMDDFVEAIFADTPVRVGNSNDALQTLQLVDRIYAADPSWSRSAVLTTPGGSPAEPPVSEAVEPSPSATYSRHVVVSDELRESQIHPRDLYENYLRLSEKSASSFFDPTTFETVNCPMCGSSKRQVAFQKWGFTYQECDACRSLYVSPRPVKAELTRYRNEAESSLFWRQRFLTETAESRDEKIFEPRRNWISLICAEQFGRPVEYGDFGSKYKDLIRGLSKDSFFSARSSICPEPLLVDACRRSGFTVFEKEEDAAALDGSLDLLTSFEILNEVSRPADLLSMAQRALKSKGLFLITARTISGFDLQVLRDRSRNVLPLDHLNLPSLEGAENWLREGGFELVELSTPGQLDVEIVERALKEDPGLPVPRFVRDLVDKRTPEDRRNFQEFLQRSRLSSYLRIAARKK